MALEERLELDIAEALRGIDTIEDALTASARSFKAAIADALDVLSSVRVNDVDASAITAGITEAVAAADLEPTLTADTSGITDSIDQAVVAADTEANIDADASGVTSSIDSALDSASSEIVLDGDASSIPGAIAGAIEGADTTVVLEPEAEDIGSAIESAIAGADTTVAVELDASSAESGLSGIASAGTEAEEGVEGTSDALGALQGASQLASGDLAGVGATLGAVSARGSAVAGVVLGLTGAFGAATSAALESDTVQRRYNNALGDFAARIDALAVPGFADDLDTLAVSTGNSDEALRAAAAQLFAFGESSGEAGEEIAETVEKVLLLATRAAVLNPALGDAGAVADRLTQSLARGGRTLVDFGLAITPAEIEARALADNLGKTSAELTVYERAAAGAAIATERLGDRLQTDIAANADQPILSLRRLREEFGNALEAFGAPLLGPLVESLQEGQPLLLETAETFGELAAVALPLLVEGLQAVQPAFSTVADAVQFLLELLGPVLGLIDAIPDPVLAAVAAYAVLVPAINGASFALGRLALAVPSGAAGLSAMLGPVGLLAAALSVGIGVFSAFGTKQRDTEGEVRSLTEAFGDQADAINEDIAALARKSLADENQEDDLRRMGLSVQEFVALSGQGAEGFGQFLDRLRESGEITPALAAAIERAGGVTGDFAGELLKAGGSLGEISRSNIGLIDTFAELSDAQQKAAEAQITRLVIDKQVTEEQVRQAKVTKDGVTNYVATLEALQGLVPALGDLSAATADAAVGGSELTVSIEDLVDEAEAADQALRQFTDSLFDYLSAQSSAEGTERDFEDALRRVTETERDLTDARRDRTDATRDAISEERALNSLEDATAGVAEAERLLTRAREGRGDNARALADAERGLARAQEDVNEATGEVDTATDDEDRARAVERLADANERLAEARERLTDAQAEGGAEADIREGVERLERAQLDAREATLRLAETREQAAERERGAIDTVKQAERDLIDARRDAVDAAVAVAQSEVDLATRLGELTGTPLLPEDRVRLFRESLIELANQATGPTKQAILGVIGDLDSLTATPKSVELQVDATQARATLSELQKAFEAFVKVIGRIDLGGIFGGRLPGAMAGGSFIGPGSFVVGEGGREIVTLAPAVRADVLPNRSSEAMLAGPAFDPELTAAIRSLASRPQISASIAVAPGGESDSYGLAMESARQLHSLAVRLSALGV